MKLGKILHKIRTLLRSFKYDLLSTTQEKLSEEDISTIREYRKNIKIYDIFTYNGEADILEIHLNVLYEHVDMFVIIEAPTTFSGQKKPLYFEEQKERFKPFLDKIKYFVIDDYPNDPEICALADISISVPKGGPEHWRREFYQKESIKKALTELCDVDICFVGDVDEIWDPKTIVDYRKDDIFKLEQTVYTYFLNNRSNQYWAGTIVTKYKNVKNSCLNNLRNKTNTKYTYVKNGGWHFTNMGGIEEIRRKLNDSYTEESYNSKEIQDNLTKRFGKKDYVGRSHKYKIDESALPDYVIRQRQAYKNLFKE